MRFPGFKEFTTATSVELEDVVKYLRIEHTLNLRELITGLAKLGFLENFDCFEASVTIPATSELPIRNTLRSGKVPTGRLIIRGGSNSQHIVDGDTTWTKDYVYLKNTSASETSATVLFFR